MRRLWLSLLSCLLPFAGALGAESLADQFAAQGRLILTQFVSAPFPHPKRAEGHKYKEQFFSAADHYADSTVAIFIPKGFRETGHVDCVIHFHGWNNNVAGVLRQYHLVEQLLASGRNAILVLPEGPKDAPDSFGGKLEDPDGFKGFVAELTTLLRTKGGLKNQAFTVGNIILSGHSGGYEVISGILDRGGLPAQVKEVWLFDALYAQTDKFLAWADQYQGRVLNIYTEHGGTKAETERLMATLKQRGTAIYAAKDAEAKPTDLQTNHWVFLYTDLAHNDVLDKHETFRKWLEASGLRVR